MTQQPTLSICVPSRNRQVYFKQTICALLASNRPDVEFVFTDNSDDPDTMRDFMHQFAGDSRVIFIPSGDRVFSMVDNWERTVVATTGKWVTVIGDDDYIDPDLVEMINRLAAQQPQADVISWNRLTFNWPGAGPAPMPVGLPIGDMIVDVPRSLLQKRMFGWHKAKAMPECLFMIYHAAVRRDLMERIRKAYGGRYFEHPVVDYDSSFKIINSARRFISIERPFSVLGSCPQSNSAGVGRIDLYRERVESFNRDLGRDTDKDPVMRDFPFPQVLGLSATIAGVQHWFKKTHHFKYTGWEENFVRSCELSCATASTTEDFAFLEDGYRQSFRLWKDGRYSTSFNPVHTPPAQDVPFFGLQDRLLYVDESIAGARTPEDIYRTLCAIMTPIGEMEISIRAVSANA